MIASGGHGANRQFRSMFYPAWREPAFVSSSWALLRPRGRTPAGEAAVVVHRGPYEKLAAVHQALRQWCAANGRTIGAHSLEIYGDWSDDPEKLETRIEYLLQ